MKEINHQNGKMKLKTLATPLAARTVMEVYLEGFSYVSHYVFFYCNRFANYKYSIELRF